MAIGIFEYVALESDADAGAWIKDFIQLEASGWKGKDGSALALADAHRKFFESAAKEVPLKEIA